MCCHPSHTAGWDLPDPYKHLQAGSGVTFPCHRVMNAFLARTSVFRELSGFLPGSPVPKMAETSRDRREATVLAAGPSWWARCGTARASPAPWAQDRRHPAHVAEPWGCAQEALPIPWRALSLKKRTFVQQGKRKPSKLVCFVSRACYLKKYSDTSNWVFESKHLQRTRRAALLSFFFI